jgi:aspartate racemase
MLHRPYTIGIIAGSGPEAGIDLWSKVLGQTQKQLGNAFRGDVDAPRVVVLSEPALGLSMDLRGNEAATWDALARTVRQIAPQVDVFVIACNTLNWFAPQIESLLQTLPDAGQFLSFQAVLRDVLAQAECGAECGQIGLMAAGPGAALDAYSVYTSLHADIQFETPDRPDDLHLLIEDVKQFGQAHTGLRPRFEAIAQRFLSKVIVLACTELPLILVPIAGKTFIDVTDCVAQTLAARSIGAGKIDI